MQDVDKSGPRVRREQVHLFVLIWVERLVRVQIVTQAGHDT